MKQGLLVKKAGILSVLQDLGRFNYTHLGVSNSGAMDEYSMRWANKLLGNQSNDCVVEMMFSNVTFESTLNTTIGITGAYCDFFINGIQKQTWQTHFIKIGDIITIGKFHSGSRVYLAIKNGFNIKKELGSASTSLKEGLGGLKGNKLFDNDFLPSCATPLFQKRRVLQQYLPNYSATIGLRVLLSYQEDTFTKEQKKQFFNNTYTVTPDFNAMACKLDAKEVITPICNGIISEGIAFGSIQIPKDGKPIILLKERQTIGGYPKIGTVLDIDCFKLAQAKIGTKIYFEEISIEQAQLKTKTFHLFFK